LEIKLPFPTCFRIPRVNSRWSGCPTDYIANSSKKEDLRHDGLPRHAEFKGRHRDEFTLLSILGSLPLLSISAERAARQIVQACR
jgi:hypothetical protein